MYDTDSVEEFAKTFEGEVFALDGDDDRIGRRKCIDGDETKGWTAIDDDEVVEVFYGVECTFDEILAVFLVDKFYFGADEVDTGGEDSEIGGVGSDKTVVDVGLPEEAFVGTFFKGIGVNAETRGGIGLRVGIDEEHLVLHYSESGTEVNGGGGFTHPAFLIGNRDGFTHGQLSVFEIYVVNGIGRILGFVVEVLFIFFAFVVGRELVFGDDRFGFDTSFDEGDSVIQTFSELFEVLFIEENFVFVDIELTRIVIENTAAFGDCYEFVTTTSFLYIKKIAAFSSRDGLRIQFFFSVFHIVYTLIIPIAKV